MLAGWPLLTPLSAYRAFHNAHHQATNHDGDPNEPLNSRWMLIFGSPLYVALIHRHACRTLRGRALARYLVETLAMIATLATVLPSSPTRSASGPSSSRWSSRRSGRTSGSSPSTSTSRRAGSTTPGSSPCRPP